MFLKKVKTVFEKISYRLAAAYMLFFIPCYLLTFGSFYYLTERYLRHRDRDLIESKIQFFQSVYEKEGIRGLEEMIKNPKTSLGAHRYFIQVNHENSSPEFLHVPEDEPKNSATLAKLKTEVITAKPDTWLLVLPVGREEDSLEVKTIALSDGNKLSVGASSDDRQDFLEAFHRFFAGLLIPLILLSVLACIYISRVLLRPLRILAETITQVRAGTLSSRARIPKIKDELFNLSTGFNEMLAQVENLIQAMKDSLDNIAHDLKTPLTRSRVAAELALQSTDVNELKLALAESIENTDSILKVIDTVLTVAQLDSKTVILAKEEFALGPLIDEVLDLYTFVAEEKNVQITASASGIKIYADRIRFKQVIANLLDNAIKYSESGSKVEIRAHENSEATLLIVKDNGIGISELDSNKVWERLYRGDKSRHEPGLGLGLSIVLALVKAHAGTIELSSEPGRGTVFTITLPKLRSVNT